MRERKRWVGWALASALVLGSLIALIALFPKERMLLQQAGRIGAMVALNDQSTDNFYWLSDHEALFYRYESASGDSQDENGGMNLHYYRYDIRTQGVTLLDKFSALFARTKGETYDFHISPDGLWALWDGSDGSTMAARLDGTQSVRYQEPGLSGAVLCWLGDSRHWVAVISQSGNQDPNRNLPGPEGVDKFVRAVVYDLKGPAPIRAMMVAPETPQESGCFGSLDTGAGSNHLLGDTACWNGEVATDEIIELGLDSTMKPTQRHTVKLPPRAQIETVLYSPHGDRVAWLIQTDYTLPWQTAIHRFYPAYQVKSYSVISVWACHIDGTQMHEVGHIPLVDAPDDVLPAGTAVKGKVKGVSSSEELNLRWMPDDRHLSFTYDNTLWAIAAD